MKFKFTPEQTNVSVPYELHLKNGNIVVSDFQEFNIIYDENTIGSISFDLSNISFLFHLCILNNPDLKKFVKCSNEKIIHHLDSTYDYTNLYSMNTGYFNKEDQGIYNTVESYLYIIKRLYVDLSEQIILINNKCEKIYKCISTTINIFDKSYYSALMYCDSLEDIVNKYGSVIASSYGDKYTMVREKSEISLMNAKVTLSNSCTHLSRFDNTLKYRHILPMLNTCLIKFFGKYSIVNVQEKQNNVNDSSVSKHDLQNTTTVINNNHGLDLISYIMLETMFN